MNREEKFKGNNLKMVDCCALCNFFNPDKEFCIEMEEQVVPYYICKKFKRNEDKDIKIISQRLEEICNHANYLEQYVVSLKHYLESGITGYVGLRGLPSLTHSLTHVKEIVTGLPDILRKCEDMIGCLKLLDWGNFKR